MTGILNLLLGAGGVIKDTYFNLVSLLLPGNGTNGAQNNTFLDGSSNNFTITRNGNTTQGTFSPFSQTGWGNYFNGSSYLQVASNAAFAFGTGDFSIEFWFYPTVAATQRNISFPTANAPIVNMTSSRTLEFGNYGISTLATTSNTLTLNAWNFCAASRVAGTLRLFINGVQGASVSDSTNFVQSLVNIGTDTGGIFATGYMADVRIVKGSGFTTSTVPTAPLTAISGTSLLTCQSNRFRDASGNGFTITTSGSPQVTPFSPFAPTQSYSAAAVGGSGYFDGTGDYLTIANQTALQLSGDFTIDGWIYCDNSGNNTGSSIIGDYFRNNAEATSQYQIAWNETGKAITFYLKTSGGATTLSTSNGTAPSFSWNHFALVRSGSTIRLYCNGVGTSTVTDSTQLNSGFGTWIGIDANNTSEIFGGYIANLRVVKGTAIYDPSQSTLTVPTALTTAVSGTSLLLNFTNAGVVDATAKNDLETVGNAQISTTQSKWGGGSMYFDGTGDYLKSNVSTSDLYGFGGDFAIELWLYRNATGQTILVDSRPTGGGGTSAYYVLYVNTSNVLSWFVGGSVRITGTTTISNSTWYHIAIARSGSSTKMYLNGTQEGSTYTDSTALICASGRPYVGADANDLTSNLNGYIDDLRITKGNARGYTGSTITVPTAPFPVQ